MFVIHLLYSNGLSGQKHTYKGIITEHTTELILPLLHGCKKTSWLSNIQMQSVQPIGYHQPLENYYGINVEGPC